MQIEIVDVAKICHQANKAYCEAINDFSQKPWAMCEQWQRESAINGVKFHLANPGAGPESSHNNWMKEKLDDGWVYGLKKDTVKKTHFCMVPYMELPIEQRLKDSLFISIVNTFRDVLVD